MTEPNGDALPRLGMLLGAVTDREADEFEETAARTLALLAPPENPPAGLFDAVLALIDREGALESPRWAGSEERSVFGDGPLAERLVASTSDARRARATFLGDGAGVDVISSARAKRAVVTIDGLPKAPSGRTYQFWYIRGGRPKPAGTFSVRAEGPTELQIARRFRDGDTIAVTLEPAGGSRRPTTTPLFAVQP